MNTILKQLKIYRENNPKFFHNIEIYCDLLFIQIFITDSIREIFDITLINVENIIEKLNIDNNSI
jgi:hypothetical protein